jgi:tRNA A-37 threonylcarbamoyl transferase component Bud32
MTGDFEYKIDGKKEFLPKIRMEIIGKRTRISELIIEFGGKVYDFTNSSDPKKLGEKFAKNIAKLYTSKPSYRKYVDERLKKIQDYDFAGRKIEVINSIGSWQVKEYLSTGLFGATYVVTKKGDKKEYILKTFHTEKGSRSPKAVDKECEIARKAGEIGAGPKVIDCNSDPKKSKQYIVMQKLSGPLLGKYMADDDAVLDEKYLKSFKKALKLLNENHIRHNDLHPDNVMIDGNRIYIIDYGRSNIVKGKVANIGDYFSKQHGDTIIINRFSSSLLDLYIKLSYEKL